MMDRIYHHTRGKLLPARLKEAREAKCLNMTELAGRISVTPAAISQYEAGLKQPEWKTMGEICSVLEQPISYFVSERPSGSEDSCVVYFRSFKSKTKAVHRMLNQWRKWAGELVSYIENFVNLPQIQLPLFQGGSQYSNDEIEGFAMECRRFWGLGDGPIANLVSLLESKGIIVVRQSFGVQNVDAFSCWQSGKPLIFLGDDKGSAVRSRFDAAHELGHLLLHKDLTQEDLEEPDTLERIEGEANRFASAFLLPAKTFCSEIFSTNLTQFVSLKRRWKVSLAAMIYRCKDLGVFDEYQYVNLRKQLSFQKMLKKEPLDDELPFEETSLLTKSIELIVENKIKRPFDFPSDLLISSKVVATLGGIKEIFFMEERNKNVVLSLNLKRP